MNKEEKKKQKLKILLPILILISAFVWIPNFKIFKSSALKKEDQQKNALVSTELSGIKDELLSLVSRGTEQTEHKRSSYADWGDNPFSGSDSSSGSSGKKKEGGKEINPLEGLILNGIFWNSARPSALINNNLVKVGDSVGVTTAVSIEPDAVVLSYQDQRYELRLKP